MSISNMQTWTDKQLQQHLADWDERWYTDARFDVTLCLQTGVQPWEGSGYSLICEGAHVALTIQQALMVERLFQSHFKEEKSKPVPRDTQFATFARLLWQEITSELLVLDDDPDIVDGCAMCNIPEKVAKAIEPIIAQRAYGLITHSLDSVPFDYDWIDGRCKEALKSAFAFQEAMYELTGIHPQYDATRVEAAIRASGFSPEALYALAQDNDMPESFREALYGPDEVKHA